MEKKKNIVLVLLFIIIAVMACFGVKMSKEIVELKKGINTNINENQNNNNNEVNNNQNTNNDQNNTVNGNEEKELTDVYVKNDISKKTSIMITTGQSDSDEDMLTFGNAWKLKIVNLTEKDNLDIILNANKKNAHKLQSFEVKEKVPTIYNEYTQFNKMSETDFANDSEVDPYILDGNIIEKKYMEMFNTTLPNITNNTDYFGFCPFFVHDNITNVYMSNRSCGGTAYPTIFFNKYKYTIKGNNVYVYVAVATEGYHEMKVYKGIEEDESKYLYTATSDEEVKNDMKSNPEKFELYKLTFEKNSEGMYYYKTTEKIN